MKSYYYITAIGLLLASCTGSRLSSTSYDDLYYTPEDDIVIVQNQAQPAPEKYTPVSKPADEVRYSDDQYSEEELVSDDYVDENQERVDYESSIRRFRGEEFEYNYENGYAD